LDLDSRKEAEFGGEGIITQHCELLDGAVPSCLSSTLTWLSSLVTEFRATGTAGRAGLDVVVKSMRMGSMPGEGERGRERQRKRERDRERERERKRECLGQEGEVNSGI
jgi:hypothetical protein